MALPDARLDFSGVAEGRLIARGVPYLREVWRSAHWRLFAVRGCAPAGNCPRAPHRRGSGLLHARGPTRGSYTVRVRFTPYWALERGRGCVRSAPGGWTDIDARTAGTIRVGIDFSLARVFDHGSRCA